MKLTTKMLKKIIQEEMGSLSELDEIKFSKKIRKDGLPMGASEDEIQAAYMARQHKGAEDRMYGGDVDMSAMEPLDKPSTVHPGGRKLVPRSDPMYLEKQLDRLQKRLKALTPRQGKLIPMDPEQRAGEMDRLEMAIINVKDKIRQKQQDIEAAHRAAHGLEETAQALEENFKRLKILIRRGR